MQALSAAGQREVCAGPRAWGRYPGQVARHRQAVRPLYWLAEDAGRVGIPGDGGQSNRGPVLGQDEVDQQGEGTRSWNR